MRVLLNGEQFTFTNNPEKLTQIAVNSGVDINQLEIHPDDLAEYQQKQIELGISAELKRRGCTIEKLVFALYADESTEFEKFKTIIAEVKDSFNPS